MKLEESTVDQAIPGIDIGQFTKDVPRGSWVAISSSHDRRVAHGEDLSNVRREAASAGEPDPLIVRVPTTDVMLVVLCRNTLQGTRRTRSLNQTRFRTVA